MANQKLSEITNHVSSLTRDELFYQVDDPSGTPVSAYITAGELLGNLGGPSGLLINGQISAAVSSDDLVLSIKTMAGADPSTADPVYCRIGNNTRAITAALSVTAAAGTNWCNLGSAEHATNDVDLFAYLGYNATDGVTIGFSRIPWARLYSDFSATSTNEKFCKISTITNAAAGDVYENIGRFNATLSAGAGYTWTIPATAIIINRPTFETRLLTYTPTVAGFASVPANAIYKYMVLNGGRVMALGRQPTDGTSNASTFTISSPFTAKTETNAAWTQVVAVNDNGAALTTPGIIYIVSAGSVFTVAKNTAYAAFTNVNGKSVSTFNVTYEV